MQYEFVTKYEIKFMFKIGILFSENKLLGTMGKLKCMDDYFLAAQTAFAASDRKP